MELETTGVENDYSECWPIKRSGILSNTPPLLFNTLNVMVFACDKHVCVLDTTLQQLHHQLVKHSDYVTGLCCNPLNSNQVVSCGLDGRILYWDVPRGELVMEFVLEWPILQMIVSRRRGIIVLHSKDTKGCVYQYNESGKQLKCIFESDILHGLSIGGKHEQFLLGRQKKGLLVHWFNRQGGINESLHLPKFKSLTAVAAHPHRATIAIGFHTGEILLWADLRQAANKNERGQLVRTKMHWHFLPVRVLTFTANGSYLLSSGCEQVLVKWDLTEAPGTRRQINFLPRLSGPVCGLSVEGGAIGVAMQDNSILLLSASLDVLCRRRGLVQRPPGWSAEKDVGFLISTPTGYPSPDCVLMRGRPGQLQVYSTRVDAPIGQVDVTQQNSVAPHPDKVPRFTDVQLVAVSPSTGGEVGRWLVTYETVVPRSETEDDQAKIKFWVLAPDNGDFELVDVEDVSTFYCRVSSLTFPPTSDAQLLVGLDDGRVFLWRRFDPPAATNEKEGAGSERKPMWKLDSAWHLERWFKMEHMQQPPQQHALVVAFSAARNVLLAVAFGSYLRVFDWAAMLADEVKLLASYCTRQLQQDTCQPSSPVILSPVFDPLAWASDCTIQLQQDTSQSSSLISLSPVIGPMAWANQCPTSPDRQRLVCCLSEGLAIFELNQRRSKGSEELLLAVGGGQTDMTLITYARGMHPVALAVHPTADLIAVSIAEMKVFLLHLWQEQTPLTPAHTYELQSPKLEVSISTPITRLLFAPQLDSLVLFGLTSDKGDETVQGEAITQERTTVIAFESGAMRKLRVQEYATPIGTDLTQRSRAAGQPGGSGILALVEPAARSVDNCSIGVKRASTIQIDDLLREYTEFMTHAATPPHLLLRQMVRCPRLV